MNELTKNIIEFENDSLRAFIDADDADFGTMYYDADNPISHDSNHAVIKDFSDFENTLEKIKAFYISKNLNPRIYGSYLENEPIDLVERLEKAGFVYEPADKNTVFMVWRGNCTIDVSETPEFKRLKSIPDCVIENIYDSWDFFKDTDAEEGVELTKKYFKKAVRCPQWHMLVGFLGETAVTAASLQFNEKGFALVDSVETGTAFRNRGYARQLAGFFTRYFQNCGGKTLYLYSANPTAIKIYEEAGFEKIPFPNGWSAYVPK